MTRSIPHHSLRRTVMMLMIAALATGCGRVTPTQTSHASSGVAALSGSTDGTTAGTTQSGNLGKVSLTAGGPGNLHGRVVDATGRALAGVVVTIPETGTRVTTGLDGTFSAQGLAEGNYSFTAQANGLVQSAPVGALVQASMDTAIPDIMMAAGNGPSGLTSVTYTQELAIGTSGDTMTDPKAVAVTGSTVWVLNQYHASLLGSNTSSVMQYTNDDTYEGKFGDYSHYIGSKFMADDSTAVAADNLGRPWVLESGANKLWRFKLKNGLLGGSYMDKDASIDVDGASAMAADPSSGAIYLAGDGGVTKYDSEGGNPQKLAHSGACKAIAVGKDGPWVLADGKVEKLAADGSMVLGFGAGGVDKPDAFQNAVAIAVDPRDGKVIVVDKGSKNVYVYDNSGVPLGKIGEGQFLDPVGVATDNTGRAYVLDAGKKRVFKYLQTAIR